MIGDVYGHKSHLSLVLNIIVLTVMYLRCILLYCILALIVYNGNTTVVAGDIESMPFIEALGQFSHRVGKEFVHAILY